MKREFLLLILIALAYLLPQSTWAQTMDTGWLCPDWVHGSINVEDPQNATCNYGYNTYAIFTHNEYERYAMYDEFEPKLSDDFINSVNDGTYVVTGIEVKLIGHDKGSAFLEVCLSGNGGIDWYGFKRAPGFLLVDTEVTVGGPADTWDRTWSGTDLSYDNFKLKILTYNSGIYLDFIQVKFYYEECISPVISSVSASPDAFCEGGSSTLSVDGSLNSATEWHWYTGSCGGTAIGTGTTVSVSPTSTTTYYVRGEGGCVSDAGCGEVTVLFNPQPVGPKLEHKEPEASSVCEGSVVRADIFEGEGGWDALTNYNTAPMVPAGQDIHLGQI